MVDATFVRPDLGAFCCLDELGLEVLGQRLEPDRAVLACRVEASEFDRWCRRCGAEGVPHDSVTRELAHEPFWMAVLAEKWGQRYPAVIRLWDNAWAEFIPLLDYDARYRRAIKARGHSPNEQSALKCLYLVT